MGFVAASWVQKCKLGAAEWKKQLNYFFRSKHLIMGLGNGAFLTLRKGRPLIRPVTALPSLSLTDCATGHMSFRPTVNDT